MCKFVSLDVGISSCLGKGFHSLIDCAFTVVLMKNLTRCIICS